MAAAQAQVEQLRGSLADAERHGRQLAAELQQQKAAGERQAAALRELQVGGVGCPPSATPEPRQLAGLLRGVPGAAGICRPDQRSCVLAGRKQKAAGGLAGG